MLYRRRIPEGMPRGRGRAAMEAANDCNCPSPDQRQLPRPQTGCDCGSVERQTEDGFPLFFDGFDSGDTTEWYTGLL